MTNKQFIEGRHYKVNPSTNCWEWMRSKNNEGYGQKGYKSKIWLAHRLSYTIYKGEIPKNLCVLHKCDKPFCINPEHLWAGTLSENTQDMYNKNRRKIKGEENSNCRYSNSKVIEVRKLYSTGRYTYRQLSKDFNISKSMVGYYIKKGYRR